MTKNYLKIRELPQESIFFLSGLRRGDCIVSINGQRIYGLLDFYYHAANPFMEIEIKRGARTGYVEIERSSRDVLDISFYEEPIKKCANKCIFCFIDQMPKGLRGSLYIKDEDIKHSFLNGNYVTLTTLTPRDMERIKTLGLSPLFVSVHATDLKVRSKMLGNKKIPNVREQLALLQKNNIAFHTQIVLCPKINDGAVLEKTIRDLFEYGDSLLSIAVVPVGLTKYRNKTLVPVDKACAANVCQKLERISERMKEQDGIRKLFVADEFFIKANMPIPPASYYEDYPQIENGVGLVRQLLIEGEKVKRTLRKNINAGDTKKTPRKKNVLIVTGQSARSYLEKVFKSINQYTCTQYDVVPVLNNFFGTSVTVAGLLTAKDVLQTIKKLPNIKQYHEIFLPAAMFNYAGSTLDGYSLARISKVIGKKIKIAAQLEEVL